jgi:predicted transcriptional regulator
MALSSQHVTGFLIGLGASAVGFYLYKKNQHKVDDFLAKQGIRVPGGKTRDFTAMSLEDLVSEKEHLEDLIAERELRSQAPEEKPAEGTS